MKKTKGAPKCAPCLSGSTSAKSSSSNHSIGNSIPLLVYRLTEGGEEYYPKTLESSDLAEMLPGMLATLFKGMEGTPQLNPKQLCNLRMKLSEYVNEMIAGRIGDTQLFFRIDDGLGMIGFHRVPNVNDWYEESVLVVGISPVGELTELRMQPTSTGMARKINAFKESGHAVH
jgi:hypothetical protein